MIVKTDFGTDGALHYNFYHCYCADDVDRFARTSVWEVEADTATPTSVSLVLGSGWAGQQFQLRYTVSLGDTSLELGLEASNCNQEAAFSFTTALHTYFK